MVEEDRETIETSLGQIWLKHYDNGDMRVWWPQKARAGELAMTVLEGKARWDPKTHGWYVNAKRKDEIHSLLCEL